MRITTTSNKQNTKTIEFYPSSIRKQSDRAQCPFMLKIINQQDVEEMWFSLKNFYDRPMENSKQGNSDVISSNIRHKTGFQASPLLSNKILEVLARAIKQEQKSNYPKIGTRE